MVAAEGHCTIWRNVAPEAFQRHSLWVCIAAHPQGLCVKHVGRWKGSLGWTYGSDLCVVSARLVSDTARQESSSPPLAQAENPYGCLRHGTSAGIMKTRGLMILPDCVDPRQRPVRGLCVILVQGLFQTQHGKNPQKAENTRPISAVICNKQHDWC
jgi:hypothetical protein